MIRSAVFAFTLCAGAGLLFCVQPLCAKMLLPVLGGNPAVWNTCMVFFQGGLLAGYGFAHVGPRHLGMVGHGLLHLAGLVLAASLLPIAMETQAASPEMPVLWLLQSLTLGVGLPFFFVAATSPLLQKWFSRTSRDPYFLYAASNLGSFLGLLLYPLAIEPTWTLAEQSRLWTWGYVLLVSLSLVCFLSVLKRREADSPAATESPPGCHAPTAWTRLRWLGLALVPSSLMLSVTNYLTTDIAPIPLLWLAPLGVYLLTFTLVFARKPLLPHRLAVRWMPLTVVVLAFLYLSEATAPMLLILALHLAGFFWLALVCHGELARTRPSTEHITEFYLWLALGGVLGGILNALIAPLVFSSLVEYPVMLVAACLMRPSARQLRGDPTPPGTLGNWAWPIAVGAGSAFTVLLAPRIISPSTFPPGVAMAGVIFLGPLLAFYCLQERPLRFGLSLAAVLAASAFYPSVYGPSSYRVRGFFGVHRVTEKDGRRILVHGNTIHGVQILGSPEPRGYYEKDGPFGRLLRPLSGDRRLDRVGIIGLGAGAMAAYPTRGQHWTFFEIDPAVVQIASNPDLFTYLKDAANRGAQIDIKIGDGRTSLRNHREKFGMLVIDAFGSDSIPLHLLTREAVQLYLERLDERGLLVFHISNRYLDLEPVLANVAAEREAPLAVVAGEIPGKSAWLAMARVQEDFGKLPIPWGPARPDPRIGVWTDDFSNLVRVFRWQE